MIPDKFICPISNFIMLNPVIAGDNHIYDRKSIETWLNKNNTSPLTREKLDINNLTYNKELCNEIFDFILNIVKNDNENIELVNKLIFELENRKDELYNIDITDILKYKRNIMLYKINSEKHNENEKIFNKLFNDSFIVCYRDNIIYMIELNQEQNYDIDISCNTFYNTLPNNISGKLILWSMKILLSEYIKLVNVNSDSESDSEYDDIFEKRELISEYIYSNKSDVITIIESIKKNEYKYYNI